MEEKVTEVFLWGVICAYDNRSLELDNEDSGVNLSAQKEVKGRAENLVKEKKEKNNNKVQWLMHIQTFQCPKIPDL